VLPDPVINGIAWFYAVVFAVAALHKLRAPEYYAGVLADWFPGLAPVKSLGILAGTIECALVLGLIMPQSRNAGLLAAALLLLIYATSMGLQLSRGRKDVRCGCAGPASTVSISPALLLRNLMCAALALSAVSSEPRVIESFASGTLSVAVAVFLLLVYLTSEQMIANAQLVTGEL